MYIIGNVVYGVSLTSFASQLDDFVGDIGCPIEKRYGGDRDASYYLSVIITTISALCNEKSYVDILELVGDFNRNKNEYDTKYQRLLNAYKGFIKNSFIDLEEQKKLLDMVEKSPQLLITWSIS